MTRNASPYAPSVACGPPVACATTLALVTAAGVLLGACGAGRGGGVGARGVAPRIEPSASSLSPAGPPTADAPDALHRIEDEAQWASLAARPETLSFARTEVVKFLIDLADGRRLWFTQTARYPIHYFFARDRLTGPAPVESHAAFNVRQYRRPDRRFICGSLVRYLDIGVFAFEMIAGDDLDAERMLGAFEQVRAAAPWIGERLRYHPLSTLHEQRAAALRGRLPVVTTDELHAGIRYQPVVTGVTYGILRRVRGAVDPAWVGPMDVLVTEEVPDDLPRVMGLVTSKLQAPLAHVALLLANRGTPDMALRGAVDDPAVVALEGRIVRLEVGPQDFSVREAPRAEAEAAWARARPPATTPPAFDPRPRALVDLCSVGLGDVGVVGAKAASLGEVCRLGGGIVTPGGFVVPMAHFVAHARAARAGALLEAARADPAFQQDRAVRDARLRAIREAMLRVEVDPVLLGEVHARLGAWPGRRVIFRSSTNAEDLPGFNGAGLYESVVVRAGASPAEVADALRRVWASVLTLRGVDERDWHGIDHWRVGMAVLVQPFVDDVVATGVALSRNPYAETRPAVFLNVQAAGGSVTDARDVTPEQLLVYTYTETPEVEVLARSSLTGGRPVLADREAIEAARVVRAVEEALLPRWGGTSNAADVELVVTRERRVVVVQARPFHVEWTAGRRWEP